MIRYIILALDAVAVIIYGIHIQDPVFIILLLIPVLVGLSTVHTKRRKQQENHSDDRD